MKKILAILLLAALVTMPVLAGWEEDANIGNVKYTIEKYFDKPVLDGKLDEYGYAKLPVAPGDISYAWDDNVDGAEEAAKNLSFDAYVSYDANNLYFLIRSDATYYFNEYEDGDGNAWQGSGIQVSAARQNDEGGDRLEYGIWRLSNDGSLGSVIWAQHPEANAEYEPTAGSNYTVVLDGGNLWYEGVIPFSAFTDKDALAEGDVVAFNIVIVQSKGASGEEGYIHTQIASGCTGNGKTAENLARLTLGGAMEGPPPEPEPEPEPEPDAGAADVAPAPAEPAPAEPAPTPVAPTTGDTGIILLAVIAAAAAFVVLKKKAVR